MGIETLKTVDDNKEKIRKSGLTEEESREYSILMRLRHGGSGEEFALDREDETRIKELEGKMQKFQNKDESNV